MIEREGFFQFLWYLVCLFWFWWEIIKSGYLIPVFVMYCLSFGLLGRYAYKLLLRLGYNPQREKKALKKNVLNVLILGGIVLLIVVLFTHLFYWISDLSKIPLTDNLIKIREYL